MGRTGTMSLKAGLEELGFGPCFHMVELLQRPERLRYLKEAHKKGHTDWDGLYADFGSAVDYPTCLYVEPLLEAYPEVKVILTLRDPESWYESVKNTIWMASPKGPGDILKLIWGAIRFHEMRKVAPIFKHNDQLIWKEQFQGKFLDKGFAIEVYHAHNEYIRTMVPAGQLLEYRVAEGWQPLCDFLGSPVPDTPFPRTNDQAEFQRKLVRLKTEGVFEA